MLAAPLTKGVCLTNGDYLQVGGEELQSPGPGGLGGLSVIPGAGVVHKGVIGPWIGVELVRLAQAGKLVIQCADLAPRPEAGGGLSHGPIKAKAAALRGLRHFGESLSWALRLPQI